LSKVLKNKEITNFSILIPEFNPVEEERFKAVLEKPSKDEKEEKNEKEEEKLLEVLKDQAQKEGFNQGYQEGLNKGFSEGYDKGYKEGYKDGYEKGSKEGYDTGYLEGKKQAEKEEELKLKELEAKYKKLEEDLKAEYQQKLQNIESFFKNLDKELQDLVLNLDKEILKLALDIAQKMVLKEIEKDPLIPLNLIKEALNYIAEGIEIKVKVNPEELKFLEENLFKYISPSKKVKLIPDESISKGGIFIETSLGVIDATFEKRWQKLLEELLKDEG
jgi:flagellar assembly protein FliH